mmetsp:Transcript_30079/g.59078  ORF Transcript_30079/g.59078 Transcript_30079/m.59078 type:complete len:123 (+) Transcript_30079:189-557(+)
MLPLPPLLSDRTFSPLFPLSLCAPSSTACVLSALASPFFHAHLPPLSHTLTHARSHTLTHMHMRAHTYTKAHSETRRTVEERESGGEERKATDGMCLKEHYAVFHFFSHILLKAKCGRREGK